MRCERSLDTILAGLDKEYKSKVRRKVLSRYQDFKENLEKISKLFDAGFTDMAKMTLELYRNSQMQIVQNLNIPLDVKTHLTCCMAAKYRQVHRGFYNNVPCFIKGRKNEKKE